jgi:predicted DNA-binding ribbon-helix-helix protein
MKYPLQKKITVSINLEDWLWNLVDQVTDNRSRFLRELLLGEIKRELTAQKVMEDNGEVNELLGEVYVNMAEYKSKLKGSVTERLPVRRKPNIGSKTMGVHMEKWLWDVTSRITPNRSVFFKTLLLKAIKAELVRAGKADADTFITREHAESYLLLKQELKKQVS